MRKTRLCITLFLMVAVCQGQQLHIGIGGGFASYLGDLQIKPFLINTKDPGVALQAGYAFNNTFTLRAGFNAGQVSAADRNNSADLRFRNLSFESTISELNLLLEISPVSLIKGRFTPYAFGGIAVFRYNPYTTDLSGNKVYLQPLSTEGQGLPEYPYRKPYRLTQPSLPLGGGLRIALNPILTLSLEVGYRKTFTDYIDDVSTSFVDAQVLQNRRGSQAVDLAFRTDELPNASGSYPASGSQRGDPRFNDWYTFYTTSLRISLPEKGPRSCSCPRVR